MDVMTWKSICYYNLPLYISRGNLVISSLPKKPLEMTLFKQKINTWSVYLVCIYADETNINQIIHI